MKAGIWFERKFSFGEPVEVFPGIVERLEGTVIRLEHKVGSLDNTILHRSSDGAWSIQEHVGHLLDLEPLWAGRLDEILAGQAEMRGADLKNRKTHEANHNRGLIKELLAGFSKARGDVVAKLRNLTADQVALGAKHPRLEKPMRIIDLFIFTAEHDDHHLARITELIHRSK